MQESHEQSSPVPFQRGTNRQVLIVDDDANSRNFIQKAVLMSGYEAVTMESGLDVVEHFKTEGLHGFGCVVTDYRMPTMNGLELLEWVKEKDPDLATILVTADRDRDLVADALRGGAADFLDKPIQLGKLRTAVAKALERTHSQRLMARTRDSVKRLGRVQEWMLETSRSSAQARIEMCFHPKHEAGGDFFSRFEISPQKHFFILTDVSGHDLQAAYVSAYFHGVLTGMLNRSAAVPEILLFLNQFLVEEWNRSATLLRHVQTSISISAVLVDLELSTAQVWVYGAPFPLVVRADAGMFPMAAGDGSPLGWFPAESVNGANHAIQSGDTVLMWTDGLTDLAGQLDVHPLTLAYRLRSGEQTPSDKAALDSAMDDVLVVAITFDGRKKSETFVPLFRETYDGSLWTEIDALQNSWERSLKWAFPRLKEDVLISVLLASREAVLNCLLHGCGKDPRRAAVFEMSYSPDWQLVRVRVQDPGDGHTFDPAARQTAEAGLPDCQRGLMVIHRLADRIVTQRNGAVLIMDFDCEASRMSRFEF